MQNRIVSMKITPLPHRKIASLIAHPGSE